MIKHAKRVAKVTCYSSAILISLCAVILLISGWGYYSLTYEQRIATVEVSPQGAQHFTATIQWADGGHKQYEIYGDQFYIDAKIIKWQNWFAYLGMHAWYQFERLGGRYVSVEDERDKPRSIYSLSENKQLDLFHLRKEYPWLSHFVDAEYGSATFAMADKYTLYEVTVSRTGLVIRKL